MMIISDFCESYKRFPEEDFSIDVLNYANTIKKLIDSKLKAGTILTAEEKTHKILIDNIIINEKTAEKKCP